MTRFVTLALFGSLSLLGTTAMAAPEGFYRATPVTPPAASRTIVRGLLWNCDGASCAAGKDTSRAAIICASVARELGGLRAFRAGTEQFDTAALAKCNAKVTGKLDVARAS